MTDKAAAVLRALADLAPSGEGAAAATKTIPLEWFRWLPLQSVRLLVAPIDYVEQNMVPMSVPVDRRFGERLAAVDQLRPEQRSLRVGWLFIAGRAPDGTRVFHPLVTMKVRVERGVTWASLEAAGDAEITDLVGDPAVRADLERGIEYGRGGMDDTIQTSLSPSLLARFTQLHDFAARAAEAAGLPTRKLVPAGGDPEDIMGADGLVVAVGVAVYAVHETGGINRASTLRHWAGLVDRQGTAFHSLYLGAPEEPPRTDSTVVRSPAVLTPVQCKAVLASRTEPVTVVSGAPGNGKSHTITAIASDAVGRNESVLVAAKSEATVDALLELLERAPGPQPVVFGSSERRRALAARLASGQQAPLDYEVAAILAEVQKAEANRDRARASIEARLRAEQLCDDGFDAAEALADVCPSLSAAAPEASAEVDRLIAQLIERPRGWRARRRRRALSALTGAAPDTPVAEIAAAIETLRSLEDAASLAQRGGLELATEWDRLLRLDDRARFEAGRWLEAQSRSSMRINRRTMPVIAALATALRSGRSARREQLARLDAEKLTTALPLWVGTLADIDDLLPPRPAMFDLVILDEASSIDQPLAAPALLRAKRAVVVGDPHQLRHVSFLADARAAEVLRAHGLHDDAELAARLDVRRNSAFDVAAGVAPAHTLNEHFRSNPHLFDFVARRLYRGEMHVATRSPRTELVDCVNVVRVAGHRDKAGVVRAEVDAVVAELQRLSRTGARNVGVVTPFRAQADALERAVLAGFTADELVAMDLRVGTVHGMQGIERDVVVASIGVGRDDAGSWRFVEDPHLFAVFATRAREHFVLIHSADPPAGGLMAEYLAQADQPPGPPKPAGPVGEWAAAIAADLETAGIPVRVAYPTGRHVLDVCVGDRRRAASIDCGVHMDGAAAHVERALALRRAGWDVVDAFTSKWGGKRAELAVELCRLLGPF